MVGYAICLGTSNIGAGYFAMFLCGMGIYPYNCVMLAWFSTSMSPDHKRSVGIATAASIANLSGILSGQIYPTKDAPRYIMGNAISLGHEFVAFLCVGAIYCLLKWRMARNKKALDNGEVSHKEGDESLEFQFHF
jgi:hypothetical protein